MASSRFQVLVWEAFTGRYWWKEGAVALDVWERASCYSFYPCPSTKARGATQAVLGFEDLLTGVARLSLGVAAAVVQGFANSRRRRSAFDYWAVL